MTDLVKRLSSIKTIIEQKKIEYAEAKGKLDEQYRRLIDEFSCDTMAEARDRIEELEDEIERIEQEVNTQLTKAELLLINK